MDTNDINNIFYYEFGCHIYRKSNLKGVIVHHTIIDCG